VFSVVGNDPTTLVVCDVPPPGYDEHGQPLPGDAGPDRSTPVHVYRPFARP
jgi:hypothetical protein